MTGAVGQGSRVGREGQGGRGGLWQGRAVQNMEKHAIQVNKGKQRGQGKSKGTSKGKSKGNTAQMCM